MTSYAFYVFCAPFVPDMDHGFLDTVGYDAGDFCAEPAPPAPWDPRALQDRYLPRCPCPALCRGAKQDVLASARVVGYAERLDVLRLAVPAVSPYRPAWRSGAKEKPMKKPEFDDPMQQVLYDLARPERCADYDPNYATDPIHVGGLLGRASLDATPAEWDRMCRSIYVCARGASRAIRGRLLAAMHTARAATLASYRNSYWRGIANQEAIGAVMDAFEAWWPDKATGEAVEAIAAGAIERTAAIMLQHAPRFF